MAAETDGDGRISVAEAFAFAASAKIHAEGGKCGPQNRPVRQPPERRNRISAAIRWPMRSGAFSPSVTTAR